MPEHASSDGGCGCRRGRFDWDHRSGPDPEYPAPLCLTDEAWEALDCEWHEAASEYVRAYLYARGWEDEIEEGEERGDGSGLIVTQESLRNHWAFSFGDHNCGYLHADGRFEGY